MEQKSNLDPLLKEMFAIIEMIKDHKEPVSNHLNPNILKNLDYIETSLQTIVDFCEKNTKMPNENLKQTTKEMLESPHLSKEEKQNIKQLQNIKKEASHLHVAAKEAQKRNKARAKQQSTSPESKQKKERRKLFKPLGGDKNWIPL